MQKFSKILLIVLMFSGISWMSFADRGGLIKKTNKVKLNIHTAPTLKKSIAFNLRSGLVFKGSSLLSNQQIGNTLFSKGLMTYRKGNTVYITPFKQKMLIPQYDQATGSKLVIRSNK
ncbi:MAG: hypothetical protein ABIR81_09180 [Ginsengibacter sp.]